MKPRHLASSGAFCPISDEKSRFSHVVKHLYARDERWDLILPEPAPELRQVARQAGCSPAVLAAHQPSWWDASESCRRCALADHDRFYEPAYMAALASAREAGRHGTARRGREAWVGDNGVYVLTRPPSLRADGAREVATAFRVEPDGVPRALRSATDFFDAAVQKLVDATSLDRKPNDDDE